MSADDEAPQWREVPCDADADLPTLFTARVCSDGTAVAWTAEGVFILETGPLTPSRRFVPTTPLPTTPRPALDAHGQLLWQDGRGHILRRAPEALSSQSRFGPLPAAESLVVSSCGRYVALGRDQGFCTGVFSVHAVETGELLWRNDPGDPVDAVTFSPSGAYFLWEFERPVQSGSETLFAGVCRSATGVTVVTVEHSVWDESYHWGANDAAIWWGHWGQKPRRGLAVPSGKALDGRGCIGVDPPIEPPPAVRSWTQLRKLLDR